MTPKFHTLVIADVRKETEDTVSIAFEIPTELKSDYSFQAGQYLTLKAMIENEDVRRSYSLCSAPNEGEWRVAVKQIENGKFSTFANTQLQKGGTLEVMTPTGNFHVSVNAANKKSYVLVAAGSGVTPIFSIAKTILSEEPDSDVTLFYGNKGFASIIFREEIEGLKNAYMDRFRVIHILSRENPGVALQKGRINEEKLTHLYKAFLEQTTIDEIFVCGPEEMILSTKAFFISKGIAEKQIHFELFATSTKATPTPTENSTEVTISSNVQVIIDGDTLDIAMSSTGESILDAAQKAGGDLPFACKGGVCCTCKAKILEGSAKMDVNYALEPDEVENGYILTCQAHPTSEKLIVSFDE